MISQDQAATILKADLANIVKKVKDGKSLTAQERSILQSNTEGKKPDLPAFVTRKTELAVILGVTTKTITLWQKEKGAPKTASNNRYDVVAWLEFAKGRNVADHKTPDRRDEELAKIRAQRQSIEMDLAVKKGELIDFKEVERECLRMVGAARTAFFSIPPSLAPLLGGLPTAEIQKRLKEAITTAFQHLASGKWHRG